MKKMRTLIIGLIVGLTFAGTATFAASLWQGTDWMKSGGVISASKIRENFEYLKEQVTTGRQWTETSTRINKNNTRVDLSYTGGNIGIGTSTPDAQLHIINNRIHAPSTKMILQGNKRWTLTAHNSDIIRNNTGYFSIENNDTPGALVINPDGNIGIGNFDPSNKLEVAGKIEADAYCDRNGGNCKTAAGMGSGIIAGGGTDGYGTSAFDGGLSTVPCSVWGVATCTTNIISCPSGTFKKKTGDIAHISDGRYAFHSMYICIRN